MSLPVIPKAASPSPLAEHLARELGNPSRRQDFDMNDANEMSLLASSPILGRALQLMENEVGARWRIVDDASLKYQRRHRFLAAIAISAGVSAIAFAILQLTLKLIQPDWTAVAAAMEGTAVLAGVTAVWVGIWAKFDRKWICARHQAERLRILKFRALSSQELWCGDFEAWASWVQKEVTVIAAANELSNVREWCETGLTAPNAKIRSACVLNAAEVAPLSCYYQFKRLRFQAAFFLSHGESLKKSLGHLQHLGLPVFALSVLAVLGHFIAEVVAVKLEHAGNAHTAHLWEQASIVGVAAAALLPVLGLGVRAWISAFELPRSANLYHAKHYALRQLASEFESEKLDPSTILRHLANCEYFLENEHREWLRLVSEAEWFL